jgi:hypothetical protein
MRNVRLPLALLLVTIAGCQMDSFPTTPTDISGTYKLTTVNGQVLPFHFRPDSVRLSGSTDTTVYSETLYREDYELLATGRFRSTSVDTLVTHTTTSGDARGDSSYAFVGTWQQTSGSVRLSADSVARGGGAMRPVTSVVTLYLPLPNPTDISGTATLAHGSLNSAGVVYIDYTFIYRKQ